MSSSKMVMVMAMIILVFLFGGLMVAFILQGEGVLEKTSGRVVINNEAQFAQLASHVALRAYNCDDSGGGQWDVFNGWKHWDDWRSYLQYNNSHPGNDLFGELDEVVPGNIQCSGTSSTLPLQDKSLLQGLGNYYAKSHWGNDQEGRYGKMKIKFNKSTWIGGYSGEHPGCLGFEVNGHPNDITPFMILVADENDYNYFNWNTGIDYDCVDITEGDSLTHVEDTGSNQKAAQLTLTVIGDVKHEYSGGSWSVSEESVSTNINYESYMICEGATGFIQANTGGVDAAKGTGSGSNPAYDVNNLPGKHGEQVGGTAGSDNRIRLFMVIRNGDDC